jgi:hypothetical protein
LAPPKRRVSVANKSGCALCLAWRACFYRRGAHASKTRLEKHAPGSHSGPRNRAMRAMSETSPGGIAAARKTPWGRPWCVSDALAHGEFASLLYVWAGQAQYVLRPALVARGAPRCHFHAEGDTARVPGFGVLFWRGAVDLIGRPAKLAAGTRPANRQRSGK